MNWVKKNKRILHEVERDQLIVSVQFDRVESMTRLTLKADGVKCFPKVLVVSKTRGCQGEENGRPGSCLLDLWVAPFPGSLAVELLLPFVA